MKFRRSLFMALPVAALLCSGSLRAQNAMPPAVIVQYGYADQVVVNGKIVTMDDQGYNTNPGHTYQAMAMKGGRIMSLGTNDEMKALAAPNAKIVDVGGRLVLPGIIDTHAHLFGSPEIARSMGINYPDKGVAITVQAGKDMEATRMKVENSIKDAISKLNPGDWVYVGINPNNKEGASAARVAAWVSRGELEPKERLTRVAPQNPVQVQAGSRATINTQAWDMVRKLFPDFDAYEQGELPDVADDAKLGVVGVGAMTAIEWDIWYAKQPIPLLAKMIQNDWERAASHGIVGFGSRVYNPKLMGSLTYMNREHLAPIRFMMLMETHRRPNDPKITVELYSSTGNMGGLGDDMMWLGGIASELWDSSFPQHCFGKDVPAPPDIKIRERCLKPGDLYWDTLQKAIESGWRMAGIHGVASDGVRRYIQLIDMAAKNSGMTLEDIRARRFTTDHAEALGNIPDVMNKVKEYGVIISVNPIRMLKAPDYVRDYGQAAEKFIEPVKTWLDEGQKVVGQFEGYRGIGYQFHLLMTREANGKEVNPDQKLDRVTVMKMWTTWAGTYMLKEKEWGTLEPGKWADYVVLDRDFFTIPEPDIQKIKPMMTVVNGKIRYVGPEFGKQIGEQTTGYQFPEGYLPWDRSSMGAGANGSM